MNARFVLASAVATAIGLVVGCATSTVAEDGRPPHTPAIDWKDNWPQVFSYCDPYVPGIRVYVTRIAGADFQSGDVSGGGGIAVIADPQCGGTR
jgi:hypothetical protein